jgi:hypothetical protein
MYCTTNENQFRPYSIANSTKCKMIDTLTFGLGLLDSSRNRKELCDTLSEEIWCVVWYETYTTVNTDWLWLIEKLFKALYTDNYAFAVVGLYPAFIAGVLPGFEDKQTYTLQQAD